MHSDVNWIHGFLQKISNRLFEKWTEITIAERQVDSVNVERMTAMSPSAWTVVASIINDWVRTVADGIRRLFS